MVNVAPGCLLIDLQGLSLTADENELLQHPLVAGVILFERNYHDKDQLKALCESIYQQRSPAVICVDQEGGRVQRFINGFTRLPSMRDIAANYHNSPDRVKARLAEVIHQQLGELLACGVNVNLAPVLDLDDGVSAVIGERSLGANADQVIDLAQTVLAVHAQLNMPSVAKHFPGHGGVTVDSHHELPIDHRRFEQIAASDMRVFKQLSPFLDAVMTAHIVFPDVDQYTPTFSRKWLTEILREQCRFNGVVFSDDLSMQGACHVENPSDRCALALEAGCDLLLLCNERDATVQVLDQLRVSETPWEPRRVLHWTQQLRGPWLE